MGSAPLFYDNPAVHREDPAPANCPHSINADKRIRMFRRGRQESRAGPIRSLPIPATFAEQVVRRGNDHRPYEEEQENDDVFHGRMMSGSIGVHVRFQPL